VAYRKALAADRGMSSEPAAAEPAAGAVARPVERAEELEQLLACPPDGYRVRRDKEDPDSVAVLTRVTLGGAGVALGVAALLAWIIGAYAGFAMDRRMGLWRILYPGGILVACVLMLLCLALAREMVKRSRLRLTPSRIIAEGTWFIWTWRKRLSLSAPALVGVRIDLGQGNTATVHAVTATEGSRLTGYEPRGRGVWFAKVVSAYYGVPLSSPGEEAVQPAPPDPYARTP
jgi:hypothetical protein